MAIIRVEPSSLSEASEKLHEAANHARGLGHEVALAAASAPSYDGQFAPQVESMAAEIETRMSAISDRLSALSAALAVKANEFEAADLQSQQGVAGLQFRFQDWLKQAASLRPLAAFAEWVGLYGSPSRSGPEVEDGGPPWYAPALEWLADGWNRAVIGSQSIVGFTAVLLSRAGEGAQNLVNLIGITQYMQARNDAALATYLHEYIFLVQPPGLPAAGPITGGLLNMARLDSNGDPISPVGLELSAMISQRSVNVSFIDIGGGASPWVGRIIIDDLYLDPGEMETPFGSGLIAHELTHNLHRELADPKFFPGGGFGLSEPSRAVVGDSTNYMEVLAYTVGETVEYDLLKEKEATVGLLPFEQVRVHAIEDNLATFTDPDAWNATRYVVSTHRGAVVYERNYVVELAVDDHRIPDGGWDLWLTKIGFSSDAVDHIRDIASQGTPQYIDQGLIDPNTGAYVTATPSPTASPTQTYTTTPTATPTHTATPFPSPTPTPTPTPAK